MIEPAAPLIDGEAVNSWPRKPNPGYTAAELLATDVAGLDEAIEAAERTFANDTPWNIGGEELMRLGRAVRAAAPILVRAALEEVVSRAHLCDDCRVNVRGLARP